MKRISVILLSIFIAQPAYSNCTTTDGHELCFEASSPSLSSTLIESSQVGDINGDGVLDLVRKESSGGVDDRIVIYLGTECTIGLESSLCFETPHETAIFDIKGFSVRDIDGDGNADIEVRTATDNIQVYLQRLTVEKPNTPSEFVSLLGTNSLTAASYTASSTYSDGSSGYEPAGSFDGYRFKGSVGIVPEAISERYGYGTWTSFVNSNANQWLNIEFSINTMVESFEIFSKSGYAMRLPKDITIQYSMDGINYTDHESFIIQEVDSQVIMLSTPTPFVKHFRIFMHNNHGVNAYLQVDEILLKGWLQQ
ncbi:hypothetical protein [Motiliproteus sp. MSK22-1]|uniref:hypothetical protein n=1 Tax=Motiliproteus sp. MSK22-1 TaxID=1897630 RepID=UPI000975EC3F|nr:hypothetical protein [Motiliproteus sp. MSK22-1]OMH30322.1 hypothetical protein BGP75_18220 [Motiliproteus sp. MSK22-1]